MKDKRDLFQPFGVPWRDRAQFGELASVMDPGDSKGRKNRYVDYLHKLCIYGTIKNCPNSLILDFGCGTGRFMSWLSGLGYHVCGAEITEEMIQIAQQNDPHLDHILYDGFHLPFKEHSFDLILSVWVLQHFSDKFCLKSIANQLISTLKPGGKIVLIEQVVGHNSDYYITHDCMDYLSAFDTCDCIFRRPIIKGNSFVLFLIKHGIIPPISYPIIGRIHLFLSKYRGIPKTGYRDFLFVFEKRG